MRVFVAGGSGFIGTPFVEHALAAGHEVQVLTRSSASAEKIKALGATPIDGDLRTSGPWQKHARAAQWVVHLAQPLTFGGRVTKKRAEAYRDERLLMDTNLLDGLDLSVTQRVLYVSGTSYYGDQGAQLRDESATPNPCGFGPYIAGAVEAVQRRIELGSPIVFAFPGYVYGPGSWFAEYIFPAIAAGKKVNALRGPARWGSMVHQADCGRALLHLAQNGETGSRYFVVDDRPVEWPELFEVTAKCVGVPLRIRRSPEWLARLILGPISTASLTSDARLSNARLKASGFTCRFPTIDSGVPDVVHALRTRNLGKPG